MGIDEFIQLFKDEECHCVYRLINDDGIVIYVGSTSSPSNRIYAHSRSDKEFSTIEFTVYPSFHDLAKNEALQIIEYAPILNTTVPSTPELITLKKAQETITADMRRLTRNLPHLFCRGKTSYLSTPDFNELRNEVINEALRKVKEINSRQSVVNELIMAKYKKVTK